MLPFPRIPINVLHMIFASYILLTLCSVALVAFITFVLGSRYVKIRKRLTFPASAFLDLSMAAMLLNAFLVSYFISVKFASVVFQVI